MLVEERVTALLSGFFATLALLLASIGLYGLMSYAVTRRTREIGIRVAVGAQRQNVLWLVLRETLTLALLGIVIGIPAALAVSRLIAEHVLRPLAERSTHHRCRLSSPSRSRASRRLSPSPPRLLHRPHRRPPLRIDSPITMRLSRRGTIHRALFLCSLRLRGMTQYAAPHPNPPPC